MDSMDIISPSVNIIQKKSLKRLTIEEKQKVIRDINKGRSTKYLSKKYDVSKSTILIIKNRRNEIQTYTQDIKAGNRKSLRRGIFPEMEKILYQWYVQTKKTKVRIYGNDIRQKAIELHRKLKNELNYVDKFEASDGWLHNFRRRYLIHLQENRGYHKKSEIVQQYQEKSEDEEEEDENSESMEYQESHHRSTTCIIDINNIKREPELDIQTEEDPLNIPRSEILSAPQTNRGISHAEAVQYIDKIIKYAHQNKKPSRHLAFLSQIRFEALLECQQSLEIVNVPILYDQ